MKMLNYVFDMFCALQADSHISLEPQARWLLRQYYDKRDRKLWIRNELSMEYLFDLALDPDPSDQRAQLSGWRVQKLRAEPWPLDARRRIFRSQTSAHPHREGRRRDG